MHESLCYLCINNDLVSSSPVAFHYELSENILSNQKDHVVVGICRCQRPAGLVPSSMLGLESLTGELDEFGFEDFLNGEFLFILVSYIVPTAWIGISS